MLAMILDIVIIVLLLITLGGGLRLQSSLSTFRTNSADFEPLIHALDKAAERAEAALGGLRQMAEATGARLAQESSETQHLLDELGFMTSKADQLADKLDGAISLARSHDGKPMTAPASSADPLQAQIKSKDQRRRPPDLEQRLKTLR